MAYSPRLRLFVITLAAALALFACAGTPPAEPDGTAHLLPHKLVGSGSPIVVFDAGAGEKWRTWDKVLPEVSQFTRAYAYTRRGYVGTQLVSNRDGSTIVEELRAQLRANHLEPPYILVGHSIGGLYMQIFAQLHPDEVAGVVLVDTTHPDQMDRMQRERPGNYRLMKTMTALQGATTIGAEMRGIVETQKEWHATGPLPRVPTILLSAQRDTAINGAGFTGFIQQLHRELAAEWPGAELRMVDSDHFVQRNRPEAVVQAVRDVFARVAR
jgi:pimeloyl-ACP methyl ester carboxylesterase